MHLEMSSSTMNAQIKTLRCSFETKRSSASKSFRRSKSRRAKASSSSSSSSQNGKSKAAATSTSDKDEKSSSLPFRAIPGGTPEDPSNERKGRNDGRPTYCPPSYAAMCMDAFGSVQDALNDGEKLLEVEFPAVPGEDADYRAASDVYIDANVQYALVIGSSLYEKLGKRVQICLPDGVEFRRAKKVFSNSLMMSEGVALNTLDGKKQDASITGMFQKMSAGRGLRSGSVDDEMDDDFENADVFIIVNVSCGELLDVEQFVKTTSGGRPIIMLNNQLDTLRADLGLFSFPPKSLHYDLLSYFKPVFYLRSRAYSRSITVSPFVVNYSGAVFREYPAPWQVMIKQSNGVLACIAEDEDRFTLGEAKEEMLIALGLSDPEGSFMKTARSGFVVNTWWEEEDDAEKSDAWRT